MHIFQNVACTQLITKKLITNYFFFAGFVPFLVLDGALL